VSNLTITGAGFDGMQLNSSADGGVSWALTPASALTCAFTGAPSSAATIINDTTITCTSPAPTAVGTLPLKISMGAFTAGHPLSFPSFGVFDPSNYKIQTLWPNGGAYNRESDLAITGTFTGADWGAIRCRVGGWVGTGGFLINDTHAVCRKPRFPDSERAAVGDYAVAFSPNGQCFSSASSNSSSNSSSVMFKTYNSQVNSLAVSGAPAISSVTLQVVGAGFVYPALVGSVCRFARQGAVPPVLLTPPLLTPPLPSSIVFTSLTTVSSTLVRCPTPASGTAGTWTVQVLQNGLDPEPTLYGSDPEFTEYDLTAVRVMALVPPGGVTGTSTSVTVVGSGFAVYGEGQLTCRVGGATLVPAVRLDSGRILCEIPARQNPGRVNVAVSLNAGSPSTFSTDWIQFNYYIPPYLATIMPTRGGAQGGTTITISGMGFSSLAPEYPIRASFMRCRFGSEVQRQPPLAHSDTSVVCNTTWGPNGARPVSLALNGATFVTRLTEFGGSAQATNADVPQFTFVGLHPPALLEVFFDQAGTKLNVRFDSQPTNRGLMNGLGPCSMVLDDATSMQLRGSALADALCDWVDDSTMFAQLTLYTNASAGMRVGVRANVLWPRSYTGSCNEPDSKCTPAQALDVDAFFPCDRRDTTARDACVTPTALVQAPNEISSCPGTSLTLDATRSSGGGVRPLLFQWSASPRTCDNYYAISSRLSTLNSADQQQQQTVELTGADLDGGNHFEIILIVRSFLGSSSTPYTIIVTRAALPVPLLTIQAPPLLQLPVSAPRTALQGKASIAECFASSDSSSAAIDFTWAHIASYSATNMVPLELNAAPLALDPVSRMQRDLFLLAHTFTQGIRYRLQLSGCMRGSNATCGAYSVDVMLRNEPLQALIAGGDRSVGDDDPFVIDACASSDPDDASAILAYRFACMPLSANMTARDELSFPDGDVGCFGLIADGAGGAIASTTARIALPSPSSCAWSISNSTLASGRYAFRVTVVKTDGETAIAIALIEIKSGSLPLVLMQPLAATKQNPSDKLRLISVASVPRGVVCPRGTMCLAYEWSMTPASGRKLRNKPSEPPSALLSKKM
jgi:hypothetical protein